MLVKEVLGLESSAVVGLGELLPVCGLLAVAGDTRLVAFAALSPPARSALRGAGGGGGGRDALPPRAGAESAAGVCSG